MNFAPYEDHSPETTRALSPVQSPSPRLSISPSAARPKHQQSAGGNALSPQGYQNAAAASSYFSPRGSADLERGAERNGSSMFGGSAGAIGREDLDLFQTRLGIRMDWEACLAYLLLPPAGGVLLLLLEHRSDYVRFHAWQSALLFSFLFVVHVIFSFSSVISWLLLLLDLLTITFLTMRAYRDAETLDRCEVPFFGRLASSILDDE